MARVLFLVTSSGLGGAEVALWQLLRRLDRGRFEPVVVSLKPPGEIAERIRGLGIEVHALGVGDETGPYGALETYLAGRRLPALLGGRRVDIVHALLFRANILARLLAGALGGPRVVNAVRVTPEEEGRWQRRVDRLTARRVDRFLALSRSLADELAARLALPPGRVRVVPNGIDLAEADRELAAARPLARARLGLRRTDLAVAAVGRLHRQKGLGHLLEAFRALLEAHPGARLLLAGEGPLRGALESAVAGQRLQPFVRFLGAQPAPWPLLAAADVFALPSLWEGMPNALLEAMAAGVPAVATAVGAVPEVLAGGAGLLVPPGDVPALAGALRGLADAPSRRAGLGAAGRRRVEEAYRIEATVAAVESLYEELLAGAAA